MGSEEINPPAKIEVMAENLSYPQSLTFDDLGDCEYIYRQLSLPLLGKEKPPGQRREDQMLWYLKEINPSQKGGKKYSIYYGDDELPRPMISLKLG